MKHIVALFVWLIAATSVYSDENVEVELDDDICGDPTRSTGFIVFGNQFKRGDFPWMVALMDLRNTTLVSSNLVLTGMHKLFHL